MKIRILIADDHEIFRRGLKDLLGLQKDMEVVGEAENGKVAIAKAHELRPDVVLMDVNMPVMNGAEATSRILAEMPDVKILALSVQAENGYMASMIHAGVRGYILKGCESEELFSLIRRTADVPLPGRNGGKRLETGNGRG